MSDPPLTDPDPIGSGPHPDFRGGTESRLGDGPEGDPREWYRERLAAARASAGQLEVRSRRISSGRAVAFVLGFGPLLLLETSPRTVWPALLGLAALGITAFVALMASHRRVRRRLRRAEIRQALAAEGTARLARDWDRCPLPDLGPVSPVHPWADDLDMVGRASLGHLLGTVSTGPGRAALRQALLDPFAPPPPDPIPWLQALATPERAAGGEGGGRWEGREAPDETWARRRTRRAEAVRELATHPGFLEEIQLLAREVTGRRAPGALEPFLVWARGSGWRRDRRWSVPAARILSLANPLLLALWFAGTVSLPFWVLGVVAALGIHRRVEREAAWRFEAAEAAEGSVGRWAAILEAAGRIPGDRPQLADLRATLAGGEEKAPHHALLHLRRLSDWAGVRRSSLAHFPLVALFCWDVHLLDRIERWQSRHGGRVDGWVRVLGEVELLVAMATLQFDHPDWTGAEFPPEHPGTGPAAPAAGADGVGARAPADGQLPAGGAGGIRTRTLRHPLLPPHEAVPNSLDVPGAGRLLLVTGSNMSGKSTLLRALGTNQVLALAGAPVAAGRFLTRPALPWTAMRIRDSLSQGVSFFLAELHRLNQVVEAARRSPVLVLLDEILQGTNTAERRIAARTVLRHLLRTDAMGAVSTHDLTLARAPDLEARLVEIHLREEVREEGGRRTLHFDHRIRTGPATSRNALILLEMVGLGADPRDPPEAPEA
jgi:hypothetical protein